MIIYIYNHIYNHIYIYIYDCTLITIILEGTLQYVKIIFEA